MPTNQFVEGVVDINNPPRRRYVHKEFPMAMYHHDSGAVVTVQDAKQMAIALRKGYHKKPSADHDYSRIGAGGVAAKAAPVEKRPQEELLEEMPAEE